MFQNGKLEIVRPINYAQVLRMKSSLILPVIFVIVDLKICQCVDQFVHNLTSSGNESILRKGSLGAPIQSVFCWRKQVPTLGKFWSSITLNINITETEALKVNL